MKDSNVIIEERIRNVISPAISGKRFDGKLHHRVKSYLKLLTRNLREKTFEIAVDMIHVFAFAFLPFSFWVTLYSCDSFYFFLVLLQYMVNAEWLKKGNSEFIE